MRQNNLAIIINGNMVADVTSSSLLLEQIFTASIQAVWTGSPTGSLVVQVSNDVGIDPQGTGVVNWSDITGSSVTIAGNTGNYWWNLNDIGSRWARLKYNFVSGTGTINARQNLKGI